MATINGTNGDDNSLGLGTATAGNDSYVALDGRDFLFPSSGNDTLNGGPGEDTAIYDASSQVLTNGITINNTTAAIGSVAAQTTDKRGFGTDVLIAMESFHGTFFNDQIYLGETEDGSYTIDRAGDDLVVAFQGATTEGNFFVAGPGNDTYVGGQADNDQIDYSNTDIPQTQGVNVAFTSAGVGTAVDAWGNTDIFSGIERITGTAFADRIIMGAEDRSDVTGGAGNDTLDGGAGTRDRLRYDREISRGGFQGVVVDLAAGTATDSFGNIDTISNFEQVIGTDFGDTLRGDDASNYFEGNRGDDLLEGRGDEDFFRGGAGDDTINGGEGGVDDYDRVEYDEDAEDADGQNGVIVDLAAGTATDGYGDTDTLIGIENVSGTDFNDTIRGDDGDNFFESGAGDDLMEGRAGEGRYRGGAGNDTINGGSDYDETRYDSEDGTQAVNVNLLTGTATDEFGNSDTLTSVEGVIGTNFNDTLRGNDDSNFFDGRRGDDLMEGGLEADFFGGGAGNDTLNGGEGGVDDFDRADYGRDAEDADGQNGVIVDLAAGTATDGYGDTDTLIGIENVSGTDSADRITGDDDENSFDGFAGNDTLIGGAGGDYFAPGKGNDSIEGGANGALGQSDELSYGFDENITTGISVTFSSEFAGTVIDFAGGTDTFTGIERIRGTQLADTFIGSDGLQKFRGLGGDDFFDGGAGDQDQIDYSRDEEDVGATTGVTVNMVNGTATDGYGDSDTFTNIEEVRGTKFGDSILGNDGDNELYGDAGNDTLDGGLGENYLQGGQGNDTIISRSGRDGIEAGAGDDTITIYQGSDNEDRPYVDPGLGSDTIIAIGDAEFNLSYRSLDQGVQIDLALGQTLKQGGAVDTFGIVHQVTGSFGNDTIFGTDREYEAYEASFGSDVIDGRGGFDELRFTDEQETGVTVDMVAGTATGAFSTLVTFTNIESIQGSRGADTVTGSDAEYEQFRLLGGDDTIDGGGGFDEVAYNSDQFFGGEGVGITVDLAAGTATDGLGDTDSLTSIEGVRGTDWADTISGSSADNWLNGLNGTDAIDGREGDDTLIGDSDADILTGGTGSDVFRGMIADLNGDTITDLAAGERIWVVDQNGDDVGANITTDGTSIFIDTTGDGVAEAVMINAGGFTGPIASYGGPVGGTPPVAARITLDGNASFAATVGEGNSGTTTVTATIQRSGDLASSVTVTYLVAGFGAAAADATDLASGFGAGSVTFAAGQTEAQVTLQVQGDLLREATEALSLTLTGATGTGVLPVELAASETYIRILNDDFLQRVNISGQKVQEDTGALTFTVTRDGTDLSQALTVSYTLSGGDGLRDADPDDVVGGLPQSGTVTFAAGQSVATITLVLTADPGSEFHEIVVAQITGIGGPGAADHEIGTGQAVGEIRNDDGVPPLTGIGFIPSASSYADPHLITFDGLAYDFQAVGEFTLVEAVSGDPLSVQVRYSAVPGSDLASQTTAVATDLGGVRLAFDVTAANVLIVDGVAVDLASAAGGLDVGNGQIFFDGEALTVVYASGEQMRVDVFDGFLNVSLSVLEGHALRGLLGSNDGNSGNDLALRDGTVLAQPVSFADLYGSYADSWRLTDATSFFDYPAGQGTADFTDESFPSGALSLDDIPDALLAIAEAAAAGISDPILREAAILDFLLSGNADYVAAALNLTATPDSQTAPTDAPQISKAIGVFASDSSIVEGDDGATTLVYTVYRTGDLSDTAGVVYQINGKNSSYGSGNIAFAAGEAVKSVLIDISGDKIVERDDEIVFQFQAVAPGTLILNSRVVTDLLDDDSAPLAKADSFEIDEDTVLSGNVLVDNGQGADTGDGALMVTALIALDGTELAVGQSHDFDFGRVTLNADGSFTYDPRGPGFDDLDAGETEQVAFGYLLSDGTNSTVGSVEIEVAGAAERNDVNEIIGTEGRDIIIGTSGNDLIRGLGGSDRMRGGAGNDWFVFDSETQNGRCERDVLVGFNWRKDTIVLGSDAEIRSIEDFGGGVRVIFEGDGDVLFIRGRGLEAENINFVQEDSFLF